MKWQNYPDGEKTGVLSHDFPEGRCEIATLKNQPWMPMHIHDFDELVFVLGGSAIHVIDDEEYPIIRGDVFVVRGNHKHGYKNERNLKIVNVCKFFLAFKSSQPKALLKISSVIDYIEQNYSKPVSNEQLSNIAGMTPMAYLNNQRSMIG